jgi:ribosomal protein L11 methyltransferase
MIYNYLRKIKGCDPMNWIEVKIRTKAENEDIISNILYDNGANGLAIEDPNDIAALSTRAEEWDFIDADLIKGDFDGIILKAYFSEEDNIKQITKRIRELVEGEGLGEMDLSEIDESDWAENWKTHYKTVRIGKKIVIKPSWEDFSPEEDDIVIELDPGMAFGTGSHETTIMCIVALEKYIHPGMTVYDVGCGSGILSVAAAKLGATKVLGIDLDPMCIRISSENFQSNSVDDVAHASLGNLLDVIEGKADIVVANIIAEVVAGLIPDLKYYLNDDGIVITSGIIHEKLDLVEDAFLQNGYKLIETVQLNGWCAVIAGR